MLGNHADQIMNTPMPTTVVTQNTARGPSMPAPRPANGASATKEAGTIRLGPSSSGMLPGMAADPAMLPGMGALDLPPWGVGLIGAAVGLFAGRMATKKKRSKTTFGLAGAVVGGLLASRMGA